MLEHDWNIVLVGMPGVGKSTIGVLLAKALYRGFVDTDVVIQAAERRPLQEILDSDGADAFMAIEEQHVRALACRNHVIATGGSVVYSAAAMTHLRASGVVVHLTLPWKEIERRVANLGARGIVMPQGASLEQLYEERRPRYLEYADVTADCHGLDHEGVVKAVSRALAEFEVDTQTTQERPWAR